MFPQLQQASFKVLTTENRIRDCDTILNHGTTFYCNLHMFVHIIYLASYIGRKTISVRIEFSFASAGIPGTCFTVEKSSDDPPPPTVGSGQRRNLMISKPHTRY